MHTEWLDEPAKLAAYVWRFRVDGGPWTAGVSGPHRLVGEPRPVEAGGMTFSCFDEWDAATPQAHLERCFGKVEEFARARPAK